MEDHSPYQASAVLPVAPALPYRHHAPASITAPITHFWVLLALMGTICLIAAAFTLLPDPRQANLPVVITVAGAALLYLALAFGIYKRSRVVACIVLGYLLLSIAAWCLLPDKAFVKLAFLLILAVGAARGTLATFRYHRFNAEEQRRPPRIRVSDDPMFAPRPVPAPVPAND